MTSETTRDLVQKILEFDESCYVKGFKMETDNKGRVLLTVEYIEK